MWHRWSAVLLLAAVLLPVVAAQCASGVSINGVCLSPRSIVVLKVLAIVQIVSPSLGLALASLVSLLSRFPLFLGA